MSWFAIAVAGLAIGGVFGLERYFRIKSNHLRLADSCRERFFNAARNVMDDDDTPVEVVEQLEFMAHSITDVRVTRRLFLDAVTGSLWMSFEHPRPGMSELLKAVSQLREPLGKQYQTATVEYLIAVTYNSFLLGPLLRRAVTYWAKATPEPAEIIVGDISKRVDCAHHKAEEIAA